MRLLPVSKQHLSESLKNLGFHVIDLIELSDRYLVTINRLKGRTMEIEDGFFDIIRDIPEKGKSGCIHVIKQIGTIWK